jgi:hypothetical protein
MNQTKQSNSTLQSKAMMMFAGGALMLAGYFIGVSNNSPVAHAQAAKQIQNSNANGGVIGVSIPSGGAAIVKGKDGKAYVVQPSGLYIQVSKAGKHLELD